MRPIWTDGTAPNTPRATGSDLRPSGRSGEPASGARGVASALRATQPHQDRRRAADRLVHAGDTGGDEISTGPLSPPTFAPPIGLRRASTTSTRAPSLSWSGSRIPPLRGTPEEGSGCRLRPERQDGQHHRRHRQGRRCGLQADHRPLRHDEAAAGPDPAPAGPGALGKELVRPEGTPDEDTTTRTTRTGRTVPRARGSAIAARRLRLRASHGLPTRTTAEFGPDSSIEMREPQRPLYAPENLHAARARIMVVKKNAAVLKRVAKDLARIRPSRRPGLPH